MEAYIVWQKVLGYKTHDDVCSLCVVIISQNGPLMSAMSELLGAEYLIMG